MFSYARMLVVAGAAAIFAPVTADAAVVQINVDLVANTSYNLLYLLDPLEEVEYVFNVLEALKIDSFALSGTAAAAIPGEAADDVGDVLFGFTDPPSSGFSIVNDFGNSAAGFGSLPGGVFAVGDTFSIFFADGIQNPVAFTVSFQTAQIPVPAAGLLLAPVLVAGGVVAMRRRKAQNAAA
jgi:hypothetical protein